MSLRWSKPSGPKTVFLRPLLHAKMLYRHWKAHQSLFLTQWCSSSHFLNDIASRSTAMGSSQVPRSPFSWMTVSTQRQSLIAPPKLNKTIANVLSKCQHIVMGDFWCHCSFRLISCSSYKEHRANSVSLGWQVRKNRLIRVHQKHSCSGNLINRAGSNQTSP